VSDWLDIDDKVPALPVPVELPVDPASRVALAEQCWAALKDRQRVALTALRDNRMNARRMQREAGIDRRTHRNWMNSDKNYATIVRLWLGVAGSEALDKDRLLARQDDIVEEMLTPKPILFQGHATGFKEINATGASRANETLMKAAGLLKDKELEINVGLIGPSLNIQVVQQDGTVREISNEGVAVQLEAPIEADWTEIPPDGT
jgi:hypothetical protein